jgi:ATP-dependent Clp protease, protease subunit
MQKKLDGGFQLPQNVNVTRVNRKIFFSSDVSDDSIHELIRLLTEIEEEDNEQIPQGKVENLITDILNVADLKKKKVKNSKELLEVLDDSIDTYNSDSSLDRTPIELYISSCGGSIYDALSFIDYIRLMQTPVHTIAMGKCMSAGTLLLIAGDRRFATLNSTILIHQMSSGTFGNFQTMLEDMEEFQRLQDLVNDLIMTYTNIDADFLQQIQESKYDYYMDAEEALQLAIIDEII